MKKFAVLAVVALAACQDGVSPTVAPPPTAVAEAAVTDKYIVVFRDDVTDVDQRSRALVSEERGTLRFTYRRAIKGFAARMTPEAAARLRRNPRVAYVEVDAQAELFATQTNPPSWGLDRIDQNDLPLSGSYTYNRTGANVNTYIFDTGVNLSHVDFGGRAQYVPGGTNGDFVGDGRGNASDCHGHGTHVAGTVAGASFGVAKGANIWAARVVNCSGSGDVSMAIAAVDWCTANCVRPAVVNMSLGYGNVQSLRDAVTNSIAAGVVYGVAAGNGNFFGTPQNACSQSPAGAPNAITVGATTSTDNESSFSNYGTCVDILAPGSSIVSADYANNTGSATMSGTSMATPHVVGAAALYLEFNPSASPADVASALTSNAIANTIVLHTASRNNGTPNLLLNVTFIPAPGGGGNTAPTAAFAHSCSGLSCSFTDQSTDAESNISSWSWTFGDGGSSATRNPSYTYAAAGTYTVSLTVTDAGGLTSTTSQNVTVSAPPPATITLAVVGRTQNGRFFADLSWSGASGANVDIYRNDALRVTTANDGAHTDALNKKRGTYSYRVCQQGSTTACSPTRSVTF